MSKYVTHEQAAEALDSLDDYARMDIGVDAMGPRGVLERYIAQQSGVEISGDLDSWRYRLSKFFWWV